MYKVRGKLIILNDNKVREITVNNGEFTGDTVFAFELKFVLDNMEKNGDAIAYTGYFPEGSYAKDDIAVMTTVLAICEEVQFSGDVPQVELPHTEGVFH